MNVLRLGDPHGKVSTLADLEKLCRFALQVIVSRKIDRFEILGDLFHTHAVLRLEVLEFWDKWLNIFSKHVDTFVLVGNHDMTGDYALETNALSVFKHLKQSTLQIIDTAQQHGIFTYMPYYHDPAKFIETANNLALKGANTLVCHQTISGSKFENGTYAPDGLDPELLNYPLIISGHIHARQDFKTSRGQRIVYPGTGYWQGISDANQPKGLWLVNHNDITGAILFEEYLDTSGVVEPISQISWSEGDPMPVIPKGRTSVELIGSSTWVSQQKAELKGKVALKSKITDKSVAGVRQSGANLEDFIKNLYVSTFDREQLLNYLKELDRV